MVQGLRQYLMCVRSDKKSSDKKRRTMSDARFAKAVTSKPGLRYISGASEVLAVCISIYNKGQYLRVSI